MTFKRGNTLLVQILLAGEVCRRQFAIIPGAPFRVRTRNRRHAGEVEDEHRRALRLGEVHPRDPWPRLPAQQPPSLAEFSRRFLDHARLHVSAGSLRYYGTAIKRLLLFRELSNTPVSNVRGEIIAEHVRRRAAAGDSVATINGDLRTLRRMLRIAHEWDIIQRAPIVHELAAKGRERVLMFDEERRYLAAARGRLRALAILAADTGLRPNSKLFPLRWEDVELAPSAMTPNGSIRVRAGKTVNAVRVVPLTPRAQQSLAEQKNAPKAHAKWVFPGAGNSGHIVSVQQLHRQALERAGLEAFPFYCWRHTFGTRCAESGMDRFTLAKLMGHSSPRVTERYYIHVTEPHVSLGFEKFLAYQSARLVHTRVSTVYMPETP
jgi:integrase